MDLEKLEQEFRHQTQKQEDAEFRFRQAKAQYAALGEDDLEAQRKRMEDEEATCRQYAEQLTTIGEFKIYFYLNPMKGY